MEIQIIINVCYDERRHQDGYVVETASKNFIRSKVTAVWERGIPILLLEYSPLIFSLILTHNAAFCDVIKDLNFLNEF